MIELRISFDRKARLFDTVEAAIAREGEGSDYSSWSNPLY
jgi:hypothetical protein